MNGDKQELASTMKDSMISAKAKADEYAYSSRLTAEIKDAVLRDRVENALQWYIRKARFYKTVYYVMSIVGIVSGATIPVINSLPLQDGVKIVLTSSVALVGTIAVGICTLSDYKDSWYRYRLSAENLKNECFNYVNLHNEYSNVATAKSLFINNINKIFSDERQKYIDDQKNAPTKETPTK